MEREEKQRGRIAPSCSLLSPALLNLTRWIVGDTLFFRSSSFVEELPCDMGNSRHETGNIHDMMAFCGSYSDSSPTDMLRKLGKAIPLKSPGEPPQAQIFPFLPSLSP